MVRCFIFALRTAALLAILIGFFGQFRVVPNSAIAEVERVPLSEPYAVPYVIVSILGVACVQGALVAVWALLGMLRRDALFTDKAFRWVDVIIGCTIAATLLTGGVTVHLAVDANISSFASNMEIVGAMAGTFVLTAAGAAFTMLVVLMRGLLRKATRLQTELAEVV